MPLTQTIVDDCLAVSLRNAADIAAAFPPHGFINWFNTTLSGHAPFVDRNGDPIGISSALSVARHFDAFWNQVPLVFSRPQISLVEFSALLCCNLIETSGDFGPVVENPGGALPYFYRYNRKGNNTVKTLLADQNFLDAHQGLAGEASVLALPAKAWANTTWPPSINSSPVKTAFLAEADFYKFRGRGVIQTTWRTNYKPLIDSIIHPPAPWSGPDQGLADQAAAWTANTAGTTGAALLDLIATRSTQAEWTKVFANTTLLAKAVNLFCGSKLTFSTSADTLSSGGHGKYPAGSLGALPLLINGGGNADLIQPMIIAMLEAAAAVPRPPAKPKRAKAPTPRKRAPVKDLLF